jgi:Leucine-rich repeat (LRR) protein
MEELNTLTIKVGDPNITSTVKLKTLRDVEQAILNYMLLSPSNYKQIKNSIDSNDFTFYIHEIIFLGLCDIEDKILKNTKDAFSLKAIEKIIKSLANALDSEKIVKKESTIKVLSNTPSYDIQKDLNLLLFYSQEKKYSLENQNCDDSIIKFKFEDLNSYTEATFIHNRLIEVITTNIDFIPDELKDTAMDTMQFLTKIDLENSDTNIEFSPPEIEPIGTIIFHVQKEYELLNKKKENEKRSIDNLFKWADKYNLDKEVFPRDINKLSKLVELDISRKEILELPKELIRLKNLTYLDASFNKLKSIPDELKELYSLRFLNLEGNELESIPNSILEKKNLLYLCLKKNKITNIPSRVSNLKLLAHLCLCYNHIKEIPEELSVLSNLESFCIHGNKLDLISENIVNLPKLKTFSISNNSLKKLPNKLNKMQNLETLEFENNCIEKLDLSILKLPRLKQISFDDNLFKYVLENINLLSNINCINIEHSKILDKKSNLLKRLSFEIDEEIWVDKVDIRDNGCMLFKTKKDQSNED